MLLNRPSEDFGINRIPLESPVFLRPNHNHLNNINNNYSQLNNERRKILIRSTGSFSVIEDNIVVPTPTRKGPNIGYSPKFNRKDSKIPEMSLFGEAGFELQSILFSQNFPSNSIATSNAASTTNSTSTTNSAISHPVSHGFNNNNNEVEEGQLKMLSPLRSSNPITLNSPFHAEERQNQEPPTRLYPTNGRLRGNMHFHSRKELNRGRSLSWPGVPKVSNSKKNDK